MLISLILAWVAAIMAVLSAFKFIARISKCRPLNRLFHSIHIPVGVILLAAGILHGIFAGNPANATLENFQAAAVLFSWNWGSVCLLLSAALGLSYCFRKKLKKNWMPLHRLLTVLLLLCLVLHLVSVGIELPKRLMGTNTPAASSAAELPPEKAQAAETETQSTSQPAETAASFSGAVLKDGSYQGSASGFKGQITVCVTVENGAVTDITVVSESDTENFFEKASGVLESIVAQQSLEVDSVSGATFSSAGLINAVSNALQQAVISGELEVNEIDLSAVNSHKRH